MPHYQFRDINEALPTMMNDLLIRGAEVGSRNGRVKEFIGNSVTLFESWNREILIPSRKASIAGQIAETMWVLAGRNDIEWLSAYLPRAKDFSDDGKTWRGGYGPRLRRHGEEPRAVEGLDQLDRVIEMLRADPLTRQAVIDISDMIIDDQPGKDIPCTRSLQFLSRSGYLHLIVTMRSNDAMWGFSGINAFEWSALQEIVAGMLGLRIGRLTINAGSFHLYETHWNRAEQIAKDEFRPNDLTPLTRVAFNPTGLDDIESLNELIRQWFEAEEAIREGSTLAPRLVADFPEPMLQAWLRVIQWYWSGDLTYLDPIAGTRLRGAVLVGAQRPSEARTASSGPAPVYRVGDTCPKCSEGTLTTSGGRHALMCTRAVCRHEPAGGTLTGVTPVVGAITQQVITGNYGPLDLSKQPVSWDALAADAENYLEPEDPFVAYVTNLHDEKHAAYGDSWKRRGEMLGIMANLARKVDRLGVNGAGDTAADTAIDLLVYFAKYQTWLADQQVGPGYIAGTTQSEDPERANEIIRLAGVGPDGMRDLRTRVLEEILTEGLNHLETEVTEGYAGRWQRVYVLTRAAYVLAERLWNEIMFEQKDEYKGADHE